MQCRNCGTEIADKALICYKCGAPTTDAKYQPAEMRPRSSRSSALATALALMLLVLLALFMGRMSTGDTPRYVTWIAVGVAVFVVALREYINAARNAALGGAAYPRMDDFMRPAVSHGVWLSSACAAAIV